MVIKFDVLHDMCHCLNIVVKESLVYKLGLHGMEERFCKRIIQWIAFTTHTAHHTRPSQHIAVLMCCLLNALVRMEHTILFRHVTDQCHV